MKAIAAIIEPAPIDVEALLHRRVCGWGRHLLGEWFDLSNDDVAELTVQLAEEGLSAW